MDRQSVHTGHGIYIRTDHAYETGKGGAERTAGREETGAFAVTGHHNIGEGHRTGKGAGRKAGIGSCMHEYTGQRKTDTSTDIQATESRANGYEGKAPRISD